MIRKPNRRQTLMEAFLAEVTSFACDAGIVPITRGEMHRLCLLRGETKAQADASAFGPSAKPYDPDALGPRAFNVPASAVAALAVLS